MKESGSDPSPPSPATPRPLEEGRDFYVDAGRYVFTERYLRERGVCCRNGCRHCPFGFDPRTPQ